MISDELKTRGRMPLVLPGWDRFSVWGWDGAEGSLFAQLWMNSDNSPERAARVDHAGYGPAQDHVGRRPGAVHPARDRRR